MKSLQINATNAGDSLNSPKYSNQTLVVIDERVHNYQELQAGIIPGFQSVILDSSKDGIEQITQVLSRHPAFTNIHIISHGSPGCLYLGNGQVDFTTLKHYQKAIQAWFTSSTNSTLFIYGCNVAAGDAGEEFINILHQITGVKIIASNSPTGCASLGGNWNFEVCVGANEHDIQLAFQPATLQNYEATLEVNDAFANAIALTGVSGTALGSNFTATGENGEPIQSGRINSVWWAWTAPSDGLLKIDTSDSNFYTCLSLFTGSSLNDLTVLIQDDYYDSIEYQVQSGTTYYIAVDGYGSQRGNIKLDYRLYTPSSNDNWVNAAEITGTSGTVTGSNVAATGETGEPGQSGEINSVWWSWTAPSNGLLVMDANDSNFDAFLSLFTGSSVDDLVLEQYGTNGFIKYQVQAGTTYHIAVDGDDYGYNNKQGDITLKYQLYTPPSNDNWNNATALTGTSGTVIGNNFAATGEAGEPGQSGLTNSVWWAWTASSDGTLSIDTSGSDFDTFLSLFTGSSINNLSVLTQDYSLRGQINYQVQAGTTYYIAVDGYRSWYGYGNDLGNITLNYQLYTPPSNDNWSNAIVLDGTSGTATGSNLGATGEAGEPWQSGETNSVWWTWTAPSNGLLELDTDGSDFYTSLSLFTGNSVDDLTMIEQDINSGYSSQGRIKHQVQAGTTYYISVDGYGNDMGSLTLSYQFGVSPSNDNWSNAIALTGTSGTGTGTNFAATGETEEPWQSGETNSVWWAWTAPSDGLLELDTDGSDFNTFLSLFTGERLSDLITLKQSDDSGETVQSSLQYRVQAGNTYYIAVDSSGYDDDTGNITLNYQFTQLNTPPNDNWSNATTLTGPFGTVSGNNINASEEIGEPWLWRNGETNSVWWAWTAPTDATLILDTNGSDFSTFLSLFTGNHLNELTVLAQDDYDGGTIEYQVQAGTTYYIAVDGYGDWTGNIQLNYQLDIPPSNDNWSNAIALTGTSGTVIGSNFSATGEAGEPEQSGVTNSTWWTWTALSSGILSLDANDRNFNPFLSVFTGTSLSDLMVLPQDSVFQEGITYQVQAGTTYFIAIDGYEDTKGITTLDYQFYTAPSNDSWSNATVLTATTGTVFSTNIYATGEVGEPEQSGKPNSLWWAWTAPSDGTLSLDTGGSNFNTFLSLFTGSNLTNLTLIRQDNGSLEWSQSYLQYQVRAGQTYYIAVDGNSSDKGDVQLNYIFTSKNTAQTKGDFTGDGKADILWQDVKNGQLYLFEMNGTSVAQNIAIPKSSNFRAISASDFTGDGKNDILMRNQATNALHLLQINEAFVSRSISVNIDPNLKFILSADFSGDNVSDILQYNPETGDYQVFEMNGNIVANNVILSKLEANWEVIGATDFDGDGKADLLWEDSATGNVRLTEFTGNTLVRDTIFAKPGSNWRVVAATDFTGDGKADLLWRNFVTGDNHLADVSDANDIKTITLPNVGKNWELALAADFTGDKKADILWRDPIKGSNRLFDIGDINAIKDVTLADTTTSSSIVHIETGLTQYSPQQGEGIERIFTVMGGDTNVLPSGISPGTGDDRRQIQFKLIGDGGINKTSLLYNWQQRQTWIVLHGWNGNVENTIKTAELIAASNPKDIVLVLDWTQASGGVAGISRGKVDDYNPSSPYAGAANFIAASWISAVARGAAGMLRQWGIEDAEASASLNIVGHSLGVFLGAEIASNFEYGANTMFATDSASSISGRGAYSDGYDVDFSTPGQNSPKAPDSLFNLARFFAGSTSIAGDQEAANVMDESYLLVFQDLVNVQAPFDEHANTRLFLENFLDPNGPRLARNPKLFTLQDQNTHPGFRPDAFRGKFEGIFAVNRSLINLPQQRLSPDFFVAKLPLSGAGEDDNIIYGTNRDNLIQDGILNGYILDGDYLYSSGGNDTFYGGEGNDQIFGGVNSKNVIYGDEGNDVLIGQNREDLLIGVNPNNGRAGSKEIDSLLGGLGHDTFVLGDKDKPYYIGLEDGDLDYAVINDFDPALGDVIQLHGMEGDYELDDVPSDILDRDGSPLNISGKAIYRINQSVDVYFLFDTSGSFQEDDLPTIRSSQAMTEAFNSLRNTYPGIRFGLGRFGGAADTPYSGILPFSQDTEAIENALTYLPDADDKSQLQSLQHIAKNAATIGFRGNSQRIAVVLTDEDFGIPGHGMGLQRNNGDALIDPGEDYPTIEQTRTALLEGGIIPIFAVTGGVQFLYQTVVDQLGFGSVVQLTSNSSNLADAIQTEISRLVTTRDLIGIINQPIVTPVDFSTGFTFV
ncbi:DUF4347 domain-containing protein [Leptolyngbya sp. GB1-A1]|uniref:DUF4347 domain-containing protein n=1 Tax=Leptolyngbya sp. GB1-A1 TaxID=2933908 RepID=UPI0032993736